MTDEPIITGPGVYQEQGMGGTCQVLAIWGDFALGISAIKLPFIWRLDGRPYSDCIGRSAYTITRRIGDLPGEEDAEGEGHGGLEAAARAALERMAASRDKPSSEWAEQVAKDMLNPNALGEKDANAPKPLKIEAGKAYETASGLKFHNCGDDPEDDNWCIGRLYSNDPKKDGVRIYPKSDLIDEWRDEPEARRWKGEYTLTGKDGLIIGVDHDGERISIAARVGPYVNVMSIGVPNDFKGKAGGE